MTGLYTHPLPHKLTPHTAAERHNLWVYGSQRLYCVLDEATEATFEGVTTVHEAKRLVEKHGMIGIKLYVAFKYDPVREDYTFKDHLRMWYIKIFGDDMPWWMLTKYYGVAV